MMEWREIESAPRDGAWIIAWDGKSVLPICWIEADSDYPEEYAGWAYGTPYWGGTLYEGANELQTQPTHWMPLPPPPKEQPHD